jgi:hypothetical protein
MSRKDHRLAIEVFPFCVPGKRQMVDILVRDSNLRQRLVACQRERVQAFLELQVRQRGGWNSCTSRICNPIAC